MSRLLRLFFLMLRRNFLSKTIIEFLKGLQPSTFPFPSFSIDVVVIWCENIRALVGRGLYFELKVFSLRHIYASSEHNQSKSLQFLCDDSVSYDLSSLLSIQRMLAYQQKYGRARRNLFDEKMCKYCSRNPINETGNPMMWKVSSEQIIGKFIFSNKFRGFCQ